jgi:hypothetical protein
MRLSQVNEITNHKITEGSDYQWQCFPDARFLDYESDYAHVSVVYSTVDQVIYQAEVSVAQDTCGDDTKPYRWLNPEYKDAMVAEAKKRKVKWRKAWDDVKWVDLETEEDFLEKAKAIFNGKVYDKRIQIPIDLEDDVMLKLCMEAHKRDITLNNMMESILQEVVDKHRVNRTLE